MLVLLVRVEQKAPQRTPNSYLPPEDLKLPTLADLVSPFRLDGAPPALLEA